MADPRFTKLVFKNFIASSEGLAESRLFQHLYVRDDTGKELDVTEAGRLSCAYVVSSLLCLYGLIDRPHATVATTLQQMTEHGWQVLAAPRPGAVAYWPEYEGNEHIGVMVSDTDCISNSSTARTPIRHGLTLSNGVKATKFYGHPELIAEK